MLTLSEERKFHLIFAHGSESSRERKFLGTKVPGSESTWERKFLLLLSLHLIETFCAGARRVYYSCSWNDTNQHDICGLDIFVYSVFTFSITYLS